MDPNRKITKKFTKKFDSKVINRQYFHKKTGLKSTMSNNLFKDVFFYPPIKIPLARHLKNIRYLQGKHNFKIKNCMVKKWQNNLEHRNTISKIISPNCVM